jgi:hypothetical protein
MRVVLDSSVITERDWHLTSAAAQALLAAARQAQLELVVPEVVVREVSTKLRERESDTMRKVNDARASLRKLQAARSQDARSVDDYALAGERLELDLRQRLKKARAKVASLPAVSHDELVNRALARRRPFDRQGRKGYRDALIWQTVLDGASATRVTVFGADNPEDFADEGDKTKLHPHLIADLEERGLNATAVVLADSLDAIARRVLEPARVVLADLQRRVVEDDEWSSDLAARVENLVSDEGRYADDSAVQVGIETRGEPFESDVDSYEMQYIVPHGGLTIADVWALSDDEFAVELQIGAEAVYDVQVSTASFWRKLDLVPAGLDISSDERHATFSGSATIEARVEGRFREDTGIISDLTLSHLAS